jgi:hypothetical protein
MITLLLEKYFFSLYHLRLPGANRKASRVKVGLLHLEHFLETLKPDLRAGIRFSRPVSLSGK